MDLLLNAIEEKLKFIYKEDYSEAYKDQMARFIEKWQKVTFKKNAPISEKNVYLITYGDAIYDGNEKTFKVFKRFADQYYKEIFSDIHFLPMFEYTSDDGFSVVDYRKVDENLGDWSELENMSKDYRLMYDFVANHISQKSEWFQRYLEGDPKYQAYFIEYDENFNYDNVVRPRTLPLFHEYKGAHGTKKVLTTFSEDQIDINYKSFDVFMEMSDILFSYLQNGASSIRLDAIGFMWKEDGTPCIHLKEAHEMIKIWRLLFDHLDKGAQIITETNVPHKENISYFGDGEKEANMVYQFALPPLVLYTLTTHNSEKINAWAKNINKVSETETFFNFLASHDGIGLRPTENILTDEDRNLIIEKVKENGGLVSYKNNTDGTTSVYELNINYFEALVNQNEDVTLALKVQKMLAAHFILLSFVGVPAIYYNSILGSVNDQAGARESGINRRINREKFDIHEIEKSLANDERRQMIYNGLKNLVAVRKNEKAFSPFGEQSVLSLGDEFFAIHRQHGGESVLCILNLTAKKQELTGSFKGYDILRHKNIETDSLEFEPYGFYWIKQD